MTCPTPSVSPVSRRGGSLVTVALLLAGAIAVGGVAFAVGRTTAPASTGRSGLAAGGLQGGAGAPSGSFAPGAGAFPGGGALGAGALTVTGIVAKIDGSSLTLTLASGSTAEVRIDASTTYHGQVAASQDDVKVGSEVVVQLGGFGLGGPGPGAPSAFASPAPAAPGASSATGTRAARGSTTARDVTIAAP